MYILDNCEDLRVVIGLVKGVIGLIQFGVPILLIIFGMIDLGKAVMAGKEDEMKAAQKILLKRFIYAIAVFLVVYLVTFAMGLIGQGSDSEWHECWVSTSASDAKRAGE